MSHLTNYPIAQTKRRLRRQFVLNLGHLDFDIVSNLELRISDFASLGIFTLVKSSLQINPFMQNKANFRKSQMNANSILTKDYENETTLRLKKNKPKTNPICQRVKLMQSV